MSHLADDLAMELAGSSAKLAEGIRDNLSNLGSVGMRAAEGLVDGGSKLAETSKESMDTSVKWMQWGLTKALTHGGRRKRGKGGAAYDDGEPLGSFQDKVELHKSEGHLSPRVMYFGLNHTVRNSDSTFKVSVFAPFWIDNRTGFDMVFQDLDVPAYLDSLPFLCGCATTDVDGLHGFVAFQLLNLTL